MLRESTCKEYRTNREIIKNENSYIIRMMKEMEVMEVNNVLFYFCLKICSATNTLKKIYT